jgi:uncharacterized coiled-coil protein SlyX
MSTRIGWSSLLVLFVLFLVPHAALAAAGGLPALEATVAGLQATVNTLNSQLATVNASIAALQGQVSTLQGQVGSLQSQLTTANANIATLQGQVAEHQDKLKYVSIELGTINGLAGPHVIFTGVNVHIRDGSGATDDHWGPTIYPPPTFTGLGNLVVGYNEEPFGLPTDQRGGSHNLIVGDGHRYSSIGGLVAGFRNTISRRSASVSGGSDNTASGDLASVSGGDHNTASGDFSSVLGGFANVANSVHQTIP